MIKGLCAVLAFVALTAVEMKHGKPVYDVCALILLPGSLHELYEMSDTIVDVRVDSSEGKVVAEQPRTFYNATVLRSFKSDLKPGQTIVFSQAAGEVELPDKILRNSDSRTLTIGERYIVFLHRHEPYGGYALTSGREGTFKLSHGRIEPQGNGAVADEQRNLTERQFSDQLERLARHAAPKR